MFSRLQVVKLSLPILFFTVLLATEPAVIQGCKESDLKKAAQAADGFSMVVKSFQSAEITAHQQGLVDNQEHLVLESLILQVAQVGKELDNALRVAKSKPDAVKAVDAASASLNRLLNEGVLHIKNPNQQAAFAALVASAKSFLVTIYALIG